jgi:glycosyltransferase involved in cell wall biosynthesis
MTAYPAPAAPVPAPPENRPAPRPPTLVDAIPRSRNRRKISAIVTTYNEAGTISGCLDSLAWCDEILVVDSFSTDETREIAGRRERVRVLQRPYYGAASQKNWAIDRCRFDWVLILDADERVTPELRREIEAKLAGPAAATAFTIKRRTFALGDEIRFSGWQHDRVVRLFRRGAARYPNRRVHADMETAETPRVLEAALDHHMVESLDEYAERTRRYAVWGAAQLWREGRRRIGMWHLLVRPAWRFFRTYVLQCGFLDGVRGLIMCGVPAYGTFLKYATIWSWQKEHKRGLVPALPTFDDDPTTWEWPETKAEPAELAPSY